MDDTSWERQSLLEKESKNGIIEALEANIGLQLRGGELMINEYCAKKFCCEDISLIENYHIAIADKEKTWDIHHRRECDENGKTLFTKK